jgi:hypothetical protein
MKRFILAIFLVIGSLAVFSATGNAQVTRRYAANIPFDFSVGKKQFKAGDYTIGPIGSQTNADFLILTDRSNGRVQLLGQVSVNKYDPDLNGTIQFVKADDRWVLSSIETGTFSVKLPGSDKDEMKIASNRGSSGTRSVAVH